MFALNNGVAQDLVLVLLHILCLRKHSPLQCVSTRMVQSEFCFINMKFFQKVYVFDIISKQNKCSFCYYIVLKSHVLVC